MPMNEVPETDNQSVFAQEVEATAPPPETVLTPQEQQKAQKKSVKRKRIVLLGVVGIILLVGLAMVGGMMLKPDPVEVVTPTPTPIPMKNFTQMEKELSRLEAVVVNANPALDTLAAPPIDENLTF